MLDGFDTSDVDHFPISTGVLLVKEDNSASNNLSVALKRQTRISFIDFKVVRIGTNKLIDQLGELFEAVSVQAKGKIVFSYHSITGMKSDMELTAPT